MQNNYITTNDVDIEDLGTLTSPLSDNVTSGLAYLLRDSKGNQLLPLFFCKDYMQDFLKLQFSENIDLDGIMLNRAFREIYPNIIKDNASFNILLIPHSKELVHSGNARKALLAEECILNTNVTKSFKNQLSILENQLIKIGYITNKTIVNVKEVKYIYKNKEFTKNVISLDFDTAYVYKPELISLYMLMIRSLLTITMFVSDFEDIYSFFRNIQKFNLKFIKEDDVMIFNSPEFQLHLPMYLEGKLATTNWDLYPSINIGINTAHFHSGIYSYVTKTKILTKN